MIYINHKLLKRRSYDVLHMQWALELNPIYQMKVGPLYKIIILWLQITAPLSTISLQGYI